MPRKTKETAKEELIEKNVKNAPKKSTKKTISKVEVKTEKNKVSKSKTASAKKSNTKRKAIVKTDSAVKKGKEKTAKKAPNSKKTSSQKKVSENSKITFSPEYYDLPYKYDQTVVKILAQTPTTLFIYWEISESDRESLKHTYGKYFFEITKPVLIVHNETLNYSFTVDIDDFANSWYLHVRDSASRYKIELGRIPVQNINYDYIPNYDVSSQGPIEPINLPYIYISSSNELDSPNDKILDNKLDKIYFRNIKTNQLIERDITDFPNIYQNGKFINIYEIYCKLYRNEISTNSFNLFNPSSGNLSSGSFSSQFK